MLQVLSLDGMIARWIVVGMLGLVGGFMVFDGLRALTVGDYLTPSRGRYAGQLGPWSRLVGAVGIEARSRLMKLSFVVIGTGHLVGAGAIALAVSPLSGWLALVAALLGLWYLPFGTLADLIALVLVVTTALRPWS